MKKTHAYPTVLLVDDDEDDRFFIELALREPPNQCQVMAADSGQRALVLLEQLPTPPDLVLLDVNMPNMTGFELLEQLRQRPACRHLPVVMLTTSDAESDKQAARQLGATDFITKPTTYDDLTKIVQRLRQTWLTADLPDRN